MCKTLSIVWQRYDHAFSHRVKGNSCTGDDIEMLKSHEIRVYAVDYPTEAFLTSCSEILKCVILPR